MTNKIVTSNPILYGNDVQLGYLPNTIVWKRGHGESVIRTISAGGGAVTTVYSENDETKCGYLKFALLETSENDDRITAYKQNRNGNVFVLVDPNTEARVTFQHAAIINDPEHNPTAEGSVEVELKSDPAI